MIDQDDLSLCCKLFSSGQTHSDDEFEKGKSTAPVPNSMVRDACSTEDDQQNSAESRNSAGKSKKDRVYSEKGTKKKTSFKKTTGLKNAAIEEFTLLQVIGKGSWGIVVLAIKNKRSFSMFKSKSETLANMYAIKVMSKHDLKNSNLSGHALVELSVLILSIQHPFLMTLKYAFQDRHNLYLAMEYCPGGDMFYRIKASGVFSEEAVQFYSSELSLAIQFLHDHEIMYRDVKPENVLIDYEGHVKLTDFGLAKIGCKSPTEGSVSICGTQNYMAPEMVALVGYGFSVDWWGVGVLIYEMLSGSPPWYDNDATSEELFSCIQNSPLEFPNTFSPQAIEIVQNFLNRDPFNRLGSAGLDQITQQGFYTNIDWSLALSRKAKPPYVPLKISPCSENFDDDMRTLHPQNEIFNGRVTSSKDVEDTFKTFNFVNPAIQYAKTATTSSKT